MAKFQRLIFTVQKNTPAYFASSLQVGYPYTIFKGNFSMNEFEPRQRIFCLRKGINFRKMRLSTACLKASKQANWNCQTCSYTYSTLLKGLADMGMVLQQIIFYKWKWVHSLLKTTNKYCAFITMGYFSRGGWIHDVICMRGTSRLHPEFVKCIQLQTLKTRINKWSQTLWGAILHVSLNSRAA